MTWNYFGSHERLDDVNSREGGRPRTILTRPALRVLDHQLGDYWRQRNMCRVHQWDNTLSTYAIRSYMHLWPGQCAYPHRCRGAMLNKAWSIFQRAASLERIETLPSRGLRLPISISLLPQVACRLTRKPRGMGTCLSWWSLGRIKARPLQTPRGGRDAESCNL